MISVSASTSIEPQHQTKFLPYDENDIHHLCKIVCSCCWSPSLFDDCIRKKSSFYRADWLVLDFDTGSPSIREALIMCDSFTHIIGTTRNHMKEKNGKVTERFRVMIRMDGSVTDSRTFYWMHKEAMRWWKGRQDKACVDPARFFFPCIDIVSFGYGADLSIEEPPATWEPFQSIKRNGRACASLNILPAHLEMSLKKGWRKGERNIGVFRFAREALQYGASIHEVIAMLIASGIDLPQSEIERTVIQARNYVDTEALA